MDLSGLFNCFPDIVRGRSAVEMDRYWMLARGNADHRRRRRKEELVLGEVADSEGGRHYDQAQGFYTILFVLPHVLSQLQDTTEYTDEYIRIHASLVSLVDDDDRVF